MRKNLHPKLYKNCTLTCACGNTFITMSTSPSIKVEICSACHPFYTGQQKFVDTEGRIEKFQKKLKIAREKQEEIKKRKKKPCEDLTKFDKNYLIFVYLQPTT